MADKPTESESRFLGEFKRDYNFIPRPAVENRGGRGTDFYPEVAFNGKQYVVGPSHSTRELAEANAKAVAELIRESMLNAGLSIVSKFREAKP